MLETWRPIPSADGYEASNLGRIRSWRGPGGIRRTVPRIRKAVPDPKSGRMSVSYKIAGKLVTRRVYHLVLEAFVCPKPTGLEARHHDGDVKNNTLVNLSWSTHLDNESDKVRHGTSQHGERNHRCKLTDTQVDEIRRSSELGCVLAKRYGVQGSQISRIRNGTRRASFL